MRRNSPKRHTVVRKLGPDRWALLAIAVVEILEKLLCCQAVSALSAAAPNPRVTVSFQVSDTLCGSQERWSSALLFLHAYCLFIAYEQAIA
jgi:hypothetical protein